MDMQATQHAIEAPARFSSPRTLRRIAAAALSGGLCAVSISSLAHAGTTVTTYQYNTDGAMTAVTTQVDGGAATTEYLTWDNFVPDEDDPTTGTVYAGNGNLLAIGPKPGSGSSLFVFDRRDRLTGFSGADKSAAYGYHSDGLMASSAAADNSGFGFYYSGSSMSNLHQTDTDQWSARLGPVRYLDDGTEEVLLAPRKDVAATYDPSANTVSSYEYDAFGAESDAPLSSSYDLKDNPHRYAGEYRDPLWGGYYLQARWYDPDLGIFLSRDPAAGFHPYSYSDGSPVMNVDPTGMSAQTSGHVTGETAWGSILFNVFVAPLVSMFTKEYWSDVAHNRDQAATFLAAGIVAEIAFGALDYAVVSAAWRRVSAGSHWLVQNEVDVALNVGQAAVSATHGGKFSASDFGRNLEGLPMGMFYARGLAGIGRRTHTLRGTDIAKRIETLDDHTVLVFRVKHPSGYTSWSSPVAEAANLGDYHDKLIMMSKDYYATNHLEAKNPLTREIDGVTMHPVHGRVGGVLDLADRNKIARSKSKYQYVGKIYREDVMEKNMLMTNFRNINPLRLDNFNSIVKYELGAPYSHLTNNCHTHVAAVLKELRTQYDLH